MSQGRRVRRRRRVREHRRLVLVLTSALSGIILVLGASGTLSSWTQAIITNNTNTTATAKAVILSETSGAATCNSSDGAQTTVNSYTCTTINKYGGTTTPLTPGGPAVTTDVTFKNIGSANGSSFVLAPGTCTQSPTAGSGTPPAANICTSGDVTVAISCSPGATYNAGSAWTDLAYSAAAPPTATKTHAATGGDLNAGASWTCRVTVAVPLNASVTAQGITLSQPLAWTLNQ